MLGVSGDFPTLLAHSGNFAHGEAGTGGCGVSRSVGMHARWMCPRVLGVSGMSVLLCPDTPSTIGHVMPECASSVGIAAEGEDIAGYY